MMHNYILFANITCGGIDMINCKHKGQKKFKNLKSFKLCIYE